MALKRYFITFDFECFLRFYSEQACVPGLQFDYEPSKDTMHAAIAVQFERLPPACDKKLIDKVLTIIVQDEETFKKNFPLLIQWLNKNKLIDKAQKLVDQLCLRAQGLGVSFTLFLLFFLGVMFLCPIHLPILLGVVGTVTGLLFLGCIVTAALWVNAFMNLKLQRKEVDRLGGELEVDSLVNIVSPIEQTNKDLNLTRDKMSSKASQSTLFLTQSTCSINSRSVIQGEHCVSNAKSKSPR